MSKTLPIAQLGDRWPTPANSPKKFGGRSIVADGAPSRKNFEDCCATGTIAQEVS